MKYIHSEIYPYVVITIGLENILIIVKAVMSTPEELDVSHIDCILHVWTRLACLVVTLWETFCKY